MRCKPENNIAESFVYAQNKLFILAKSNVKIELYMEICYDLFKTIKVGYALTFLQRYFMVNEIEKLKAEITKLKNEIERLRKILDNAGIEYDIKNDNKISSEVITKEHIFLFYSYFKGRKDVYSRRTVRKDGKAAYYPVCDNFWKYGICPRCEQRKTKCSECEHRKWTPLTQSAIYGHLMGRKANCSDVIGIYPMLEGDKCNFLVFDFDDHSDVDTGTEWAEEVNTMRKICEDNDVDILVERSRSSKGAHIWMFFEEPISAAKARKFGTALLTKGAETVNMKSFTYYDRMIPAQDHLTEGGLGNLIALPLQGQALKKGNSAFVDENWEVYEDQWEILKNTKKLSLDFVEEKISLWSEKAVSDNSDGKPWDIKIDKRDAEGCVEITLADKIYINKTNLKPRLQNSIRRLAAFGNPEFYKNQAMGFSVFNCPRIIYCGEDIDNYIAIPRGCFEEIKALLNKADIEIKIADERNTGNNINVKFKGKLYSEQQKAAETMLKYDCGILGAATAFGKTVVGTYIIAQKKVNTLILVHNREIMNNWTEDINNFLAINEKLPEYKTKTGRIRKRKSLIGKIYAGHNSLTGIIDVAMISSLGKPEAISDIVKNYGMVIMDECHHGGAVTAEAVLREVNAKYVYGMTATPKRNDGHEKRVYMQLGNVRYKFTAQEKAELQNIDHYIYPRFTSLVNMGKEWNINEAYKAVITNEIRNKMIINDAAKCIENKRTPLIITKFREHAELLKNILEGTADNIFLLQGGRGNKERENIRTMLRNVPKTETLIVVATGQYIGEGFNLPRLDTMLLATPIAWSGNVEQYAGRLHRDYEGKKDVIIYDYIDNHVRVLERMYYKRLKTYKNMGYEIYNNTYAEKQKVGSIFDSKSYGEIFERDIYESNKEIIISSPGINSKKVDNFCKIVAEKQKDGIQICVLTLSPEIYPEKIKDITTNLINKLEEKGISVICKDSLHEHFAVIDKEIVWYGSMNFLSREKEEDNIMRVVNKEIAEELMLITYNCK